MDVVAATRRYVADDRFRLRLFDAIASEVRQVSETLKGEQFSPVAQWSQEAIRSRIADYDNALVGLCRAKALIGRWGSPSSTASLTLGISRLCEEVEVESGSGQWRELRWYPLLQLLYAGGVAALAAERYDALFAMLQAPVRLNHESKTFVLAATENFRRDRETFGMLEGREENTLPFNEHVFDHLRQIVGDLLFLGYDYDRAFDRFEMLCTIEYAHQSNRNRLPRGRFAWKGTYPENSPAHLLVKEIEQTGERWPPLSAGFCGGSVERLKSLMPTFLASVARFSY